MQLPDFPWDSLAPVKQRAQAAQVADGVGLIDLSVGTPVDPTAPVLQCALRAAANAPGYPQTWGTSELRESVAAWFARRRGVAELDPDGVLPTVGSKELVAWLPLLLGVGCRDIVGLPRLAYPTYDVGARLAGATPRVIDDLGDLGSLTGSNTPKLLWLNTPSNPTGRVLGVDHLAKVVAWARSHDVIVASDECYAELDWRTDRGAGEPPTTPSLLDRRVTGGSTESLLCVYSLSKQSNLAGYRAAFVAGDPALIARLREVRRHAGMIVPAPVQAVMIAALSDDAHVAEQKQRYAARREILLAAVRDAGFVVDDSEAGLYLWASRGEDAWATLDWLAARGILAAPGSFYGSAGVQHVRMALTATVEHIGAAAARLAG